MMIPANVPNSAMSIVCSVGQIVDGSSEKFGGMARRMRSAMPKTPVTRSCGRAWTTMNA